MDSWIRLGNILPPPSAPSMVMLASQRCARCIRRAYRTQLLNLQARRQRSAPAFKRVPARLEEGESVVRKHDSVIVIRKQRRPDDKNLVRKYSSYEDEESIPRTYFRKTGEPALPTWSGFKDVVKKSKRSRDDHGPENFSEVLVSRLGVLKNELKSSSLLDQLAEGDGGDGAKDKAFGKIWNDFTKKVRPGDDRSVNPWGVIVDKNVAKLRRDLVEAHRKRGTRALDEQLKYAFYSHFAGERFTQADIKNQQALADLRYPSEWYPATRSIQRTIHLHVGPTNSGKTYHALQRLEKASSGVYAGPLRLLAHEVYSRMNAKGRSCALVTGEERRSPENDNSAKNTDITACTVEMIALNRALDVAVIDEIQMIGSADRGWAWTQALLGVNAREVHLCGEERTVPLIREICASIGDKLEIHKYERLSPLKMADGSLQNDLTRLRKGDCVVAFSVMGIHALRKQIEKATGRKVATVYGSLPPETRAQQARLFNDPDNDYDFLVASDAVGMGLNLAIKRIIFESSSKFDGYSQRTLPIADIKQIAGRAGRYRTAEQATREPESTQALAVAKGEPTAEVDQSEENVGLVTTLEDFDFPVVSNAMASNPEPIRTAGIFPPAAILERFASYFPPGTPFSYILIRLHELSQMHSRFHLCGLRDQLWVSDLIEPVKGLTVTERNVICAAPAGRGNDMWKTLMPAFARCIAEQAGGHLVCPLPN
jgi:ATP-dependent RNA helicase SUPV3L1/SUV3